MKLLDLTLDDAAADVALDEALLESAESGRGSGEVLRLWQPKSPIVVLGRSSPYEQEVNESECELVDAAVVRRCSGGATILTSSGCLMYAVLLSYENRPALKMIDQAHQFVMNKIKNAVAACGVATDFQGICDLTIGGRKVSGNALRCKRSWFVYHGTLICTPMDIEMITKCLGNPRRQPNYRQGRSHSEFLTRIPVQPRMLAEALADEWKCDGVLKNWPESLTHQLVADKYSKPFWTKKI